MMKINDKIISRLSRVAIIISIIIATLPAFNIFSLNFAHDIMSHLSMLAGLRKSIMNNVFPPYINAVTNNFKGSCEFIVYPYLFKLLPASLDILINNIHVSVNIFIILLNISNALIMYISAYEITKNKTSSVISTIFWVLFYYRVYNIYERQAMGEYTALTFYPLAIAGIYNVIYGDKKKWFYIVIGITCVLESHILTFFYLIITYVVILIFSIKKIIFDKKTLYILIKCTIITLLLNIWFIIPFLQYYFEKQVGTMYCANEVLLDDGHNTILDVFNLNPKCNTVQYNSFSIGSLCAYIIIIIISIYLLIKKELKNNVLFFILVIASIYYLFASIGFMNRELVNKNRILSLIFARQQFIYREIGRGGIYLSLCLGVGLVRLNKISKNIFIILIFIVSSLTIIKYVTPIIHLKKNSFISLTSLPDYKLVNKKDLENQVDHMDEANQIYQEGVNYSFDEYGYDEYGYDIDDFKKSEGINIISRGRGYLSYECVYDCLNDNYQNEYIVVPLYAFSGYSAFDDNGKMLKIIRNDDDLIQVYLPSKKGKILVKFDPPIPWRISFYISLFTLIILISKTIYHLIRKSKNVN